MDIHLADVSSLLSNYIVDARHALECDDRYGWICQEVEENVRSTLLERIEALVRGEHACIELSLLC